MNLLEITDLSHSFGENIIFKNASFALNKGEHVGIVGPNGTGKSTFLKFCTGQLLPDVGHISWQPRIKLGYLDQYAAVDFRLTMKEFLESAFCELFALEKKMNCLYQKAGESDDSCLAEAARIQEILERFDFYSIDSRIAQVATGLGLAAIGLDRPVAQMSGGQRAKVILAKLLLEEPDVLLLDEPTNFLDQAHVEWLAGYLHGLTNAFLVISHDCAFLEKTAAYICDIDAGSIRKYTGTYSAFLKKKTSLRMDYIRQYETQQKEIKKTEEFIRRNIAGRKSRMARGRQKQLEHMDKMDALEQIEIIPKFQFTALPLPQTEVLSVRKLSVGYQYPILKNMGFSIGKGQKIVITGFNGIGKSTLLKTLTGQLPPICGSFFFSDQAVTGYFEQNVSWADDRMTPIEIVSEFILDEPSNHLDLHAKEAFRTALSEFPGTVLLVSHEETFYKKWADRILHIEHLCC